MGRLGTGYSMKYIEELNCGDTFSFKDHIYLLTSDFKSNGQKLCYSLINGFPVWLNSDAIVNSEPVYILDQNNNTIPIKITEKENYVN